MLQRPSVVKEMAAIKANQDIFDKADPLPQIIENEEERIERLIISREEFANKCNKIVAGTFKNMIDLAILPPEEEEMHNV